MEDMNIVRIIYIVKQIEHKLMSKYKYPDVYTYRVHINLSWKQNFNSTSEIVEDIKNRSASLASKPSYEVHILECYEVYRNNKGNLL